MHSQQIHQYLRQFFLESNCAILQDTIDYLTVQLTGEIDKKIMNRPFYWQYIEATNSEPAPATITCITNPAENSIGGVKVHFGSPILHRIFHATRELGSYVQLYETVDDSLGQIILTPWLAINYKVSYCCDCTKETLYSLGINLLTGVMKENFQDSIAIRDLDIEPADHIFHVQPIIKPLRGVERLNAAIQAIIAQEDHKWADEAWRRWQRDQRVLDYFYEDIEEKPEHYVLEKKALAERYTAKIKVDIVNGGVFYLL
ncbi:YqhG family protein [Lysinibacillus piscis]|uniref:YqhG n=1 Tax=Lysinibacillus piscis TaxID=2518931 RepID=A0ABQ5NIA8_9BACI|nr:YqhG family protein [Lysinibacillus sp. KH24]GLC88105.1 hypothetical protein LYSBPC_12320 [Lysinibacillus sp. KH24]